MSFLQMSLRMLSYQMFSLLVYSQMSLKIYLQMFLGIYYKCHPECTFKWPYKCCPYECCPYGWCPYEWCPWECTIVTTNVLRNVQRNVLRNVLTNVIRNRFAKVLRNNPFPFRNVLTNEIATILVFWYVLLVFWHIKSWKRRNKQGF